MFKRDKTDHKKHISNEVNGLCKFIYSTTYNHNNIEIKSCKISTKRFYIYTTDNSVVSFSISELQAILNNKGNKDIILKEYPLSLANLSMVLMNLLSVSRIDSDKEVLFYQRESSTIKKKLKDLVSNFRKK